LPQKVGEQRFFKEQGYDNKPTRCIVCKAARKGGGSDTSNSIPGAAAVSKKLKYMPLNEEDAVRIRT
jgi:hypothetical protein